MPWWEKARRRDLTVGMTLPTLLRTLPTAARVPHRSVLSVGGPQASEFLNGIIASTVHNPPKGHFFSAFLHAQGRVLYDVFAYLQKSSDGQHGYLIEYDSRLSEAPPLLSMLKRYVLRSKVKLRDVSEEYDVWAAWGSEKEQTWESKRQWTWARSDVVEPTWEHSDEWPWGNEDMVLRDRRAVGMGRRMLVRKGDHPQAASSHDVAPSDTYILHRILHGVPEGIEDIPPMQAYPMESNLDIMGGLDFRKGCYVGQELTVRTYHTGVVRKRILPVSIHKSDERPHGKLTPSPSNPTFPTNIDIRASLVLPSDHGPTRSRGTGKLFTSIHGVGLALLRLEHAEGARQGNLKLAFEIGNEGQEKTKWAVSPYWPDWWPRRKDEQEL